VNDIANEPVKDVEAYINLMGNDMLTLQKK